MSRTVTSRTIVVAAAALLSFVITAQQAAAGPSVEVACAADYFAYCSKHDPDSPAVRSCMRKNGTRLSQRCVNALVAAGEVSKSEVDHRASK